MMGLTVVFGDREHKTSQPDIVRRARAVVDEALSPGFFPDEHGRFEGPLWHSVAMQMTCHDERDYERVLEVLSSRSRERGLAILGVRRG
ncbi:hypothetical protein ACQQ2N_03995 [Dokdonella sp. MW10]|uniref:hypothetical protein n=1 Tax=Dokdonella sp. MW10 TaxID=2992926 RepID=UPI003F801A7A